MEYAWGIQQGLGLFPNRSNQFSSGVNERSSGCLLEKLTHFIICLELIGI